jgi:hypothetical protein
MATLGTLIKRVALSSALAAIACYGLTAVADAPAGTNSTEVQFSSIASLLSNNCSACHNSEDRIANLVLEPAGLYEAIVGKPSGESKWPLVTPFKPGESYLYAKMAGTHEKLAGSGVQMPAGQPPLPAIDIDLVRRWIEQGARR